MHRLSIRHAFGEYPIYIGDSILLDEKLLRSFVKGTQVFIVTDKNVAPHYLSKITAVFSELQCDFLILDAGEENKTLATFEKIIDSAANNNHHRDTTFIALGGGIVSDLTGFAAACYHRGVSLIHIPTTLLAQVDASIGGKTGVNHASGKNFIGSFYPPNAVFIDINTLGTLPDREFRAGISEIIKAALIKDAGFFEWLEKNMTKLISRDKEALLFAIQKSCEIKRSIVMQDEKENNVRALLNLGHTFAHAIEKTLGFGTWLHGEAVAYGLCVAATLSRTMGLLNNIDHDRIHALLIQHDLVKKIPENILLDDLTHRMQSDKKVRANQLRLILLTTIGEAVIAQDVSKETITAAWKHTQWIYTA